MDKEQNTIEWILKTRDERGLKHWEVRNLIITRKDPTLTEQCILEREKLGLESDDITELLENLNNPKFTKRCIIEIGEESGFEIWDILALIKKINEPKFTKKCISRREKLGFYPEDLCTLIKTIKEPEYIKKCILEKKTLGLHNNDVCELLKNLNNPNFTQECILERREELELTIRNVHELIISINEPKFIKECILERREELELDQKIVCELIETINEPKFTQECILERREELGFDIWNLCTLIKTIKDPEIIKECILKLKEQGIENTNLVYVIESIEIPKLQYNILETLNDLELIQEYRRNIDPEEIYDNLSFFLEKEGRTEDEEAVLRRMYEKNRDILYIDFDFLDYIKYFGEEKINLISCYEHVVCKIKGLSEHKILILVKCIDYYEKIYETEDWTPLAEKILDNINKIDENLLQQILEQSKNEFNMENLLHLLINSNYIGITTVEEFNNYKQIKEQKFDAIIEGGDLVQFKNAVLEKAYNHGLNIAETLIDKYGQDIDKIEDEALKKYMLALKTIVGLEDTDILKEVYRQIEPSTIKIGSIYAIEKKLKIEYAKLYNKELFKIEDAVKNEKLGENVYEAGTNFSMMITSIRAYVNRWKSTDDFYSEWNQPALRTQHFCCTFIRNDMIRTAPIPFVCFGFKSMAEDSLVAVGNTDLASNRNGFVSKARRKEEYYSPDNQIDNTEGHNEIDYYRLQNGKKKQPDYIVIFRVNGLISDSHWKYARQAQSDFGGKLPIVIVDVDKCLQSEKEKVNQMIAEYKKNPSQELLNKIKQKIKNNDKTCTNEAFGYKEGFCEDVNLEKIEEQYGRTYGDSAIVTKMKVGNLEDNETIAKHVQAKANLYNDFYKKNKITRQLPLKDILHEAEEDELYELLDKTIEVQGKNNSTSKFHGVQHVKNVVLLSYYIGKKNGLSEKDLSILLEAAIYHDVMHKKAGDYFHARVGARWYYNNVNKNKEVEFLIAAHESKAEELEQLVQNFFQQDINPERKNQLIKCACILQDADRLDILRYDIEKPNSQRFDVNRLNDPQNASLIEAVIELNTRQSIKRGDLHIKDGRVYEGNAKKSVTEKDLQVCYRNTTPDEREGIISEIVQVINETTLSSYR